MSKKDLRVSLLAAVLVAILSYPTIVNVSHNLSVQFHITISLTLGLLTIIGLFALHYAKKWFASLWQIAKFIVSGGLNTFLDFGALNLLIILTGITAGTQFSIFKGLAFTVAVINSFFWNKYWTFEFREKKKGEFAEFAAVSLIGLVINTSIASFVVNVIGPQADISDVLWANIGAFAATFATFIWNFLGYKFIVFKRRS